jgi:glutamine cyclotransferase
MDFQIVGTYPHDPGAFCQGLVMSGGRLFESTGLYGGSTLREVRLETGEILRQVRLPETRFGEGLAMHGERLFQLTWKEGRALVYGADSLSRIGGFDYDGEGWGLTSDGRNLIMSDGTDSLRVLDPVTFGERGHIAVRTGGKPLRGLNELEFIRGEVWANVWPTDHIVRIDVSTGEVKALVDLTGILDREKLPYPVDVLNGIAWEESSGRLLVTGKFWPYLYEISVTGPSSSP